MSNSWDESRLFPTDEAHLWELFHENSKTSQYDEFPATDQVVRTMEELHDVLPFRAMPKIELPDVVELPMPLGKTIHCRESARGMSRKVIDLQTLATILDAGYGVNRANDDTEFVRPFRNVPSGGALYPLEIFFYAKRVAELSEGIYHYNPANHCLRRFAAGTFSEPLGKALVQPEWIEECSVLFMMTALFMRSTFKYKDRGYRFVLMEAGHVMQNMALASTALNLGIVSIGGYFDRDVDRLLRLDGVTHSTVYLGALGGGVDGTTSP